MTSTASARGSRLDSTTAVAAARLAGTANIRSLQLRQAAVAGDKSRVRALLLHQGVPLADPETARLCLYLAISSGDRVLATHVLDTMTCDITRVRLTRHGDTALHLAARAPVPDVPLFRRLLYASGITDRTGKTLPPVLLATGSGPTPAVAPIDVRNENGDTPLHIAAIKGHMEPAAMLLSAGAAVNVGNHAGDTPLHCAVRAEHTRMTCLLIVHGADTYRENLRAELPVLLAAKQRQDYILRVLLNQKHGLHQPWYQDSRVRKALTKCLRNAVLKGDSDLACLLLQRGAYVNGLVRGTESVLHLAASRGDTALIKVLVAAGAEVNALSEGVTALHCAAQRGHTGAVDVLLSHGANVNTPTNDLSLSLTALHLATSGGHRQVVELLCRYGADPNACDSTGNTPLHTAAAAIMPALEQLQCDVYTHSPDPVLHALLRAGADPAHRNREGDMPHHLAAHAGNTLPLHQLVLHAGVGTVNVSDGYGDSAICAVTSLRRTDLFLLLLAHGAKPSALVEPGVTCASAGTSHILLDTLDRAIIVFHAVLNSGNLSPHEHQQYKANIHELLGQNYKSAFCSVFNSYGQQQLTLKALVRRYLRHYLLHDCLVTKLWKCVVSLHVPPLIHRYILLQDYVESLKEV